MNTTQAQRDALKAKYPNVILLFDAGDQTIYYPHEHDADTVSAITGSPTVAFDGAEKTIGLLINAGHKVAICQPLGRTNA